ncbi:MAG TPA: penicillin-binding transpeptidase domain-containing protein [Candidatus Polarisedimenticolia bacterium]|jgi:cell division protein FtsI (penicillin-binding protein 3)
MSATIVRTDDGPEGRAALRRRIVLLGLAMAVWAGGMGYRLVDLQIHRAGEMRGLARRQYEQIITLDARRGLLRDRNGLELAMSIEVDSIYAVPAEIEDPVATAAALAPVLSRLPGSQPISPQALAAKLSGDKLFTWIRRKVDPAAVAAVSALNLKGIAFEREHRRFYPHAGLAAHVLGWVGMDNTGMDGLELALDGRIRGKDGQMFALRDARGRRFLKAARREPVPGRDVALTIDETIQHIAERELRQAMEDTGAAEGSVIVMEPATGEILALANEPTYNPNRPSDSPAAHRKNRAVVDAYEPGSTFKVITMASALERELVGPNEVFDCQNGLLKVGRAVIHDHKRFGLLTATEILQQSSNVGVMKIGLRLKREDFHETILRFGLGARTGIELPGEARGLVREPKDWSGVSQATISFGQEVSVTPLQLVTAINVVADGGLLRAPRIVLRETGADGSETAPADLRPVRRVLKESTVRTLTRMMLSVVDEGTAKAARMPGYSVAGKTGTAQKIGPEGTYASGRFVASFVGFVPSTRPALTILVVLDEPRGSLYHGGDIAAPVFRRIALPSLRYLGVPPEEGRYLIEGDEPTLVAEAHALRWTEPLPVDEKELEVEQARRQREKEKEMQRAARSRSAARREEAEPALVAPAPKPLPAVRVAAAGDAVALADLRGHSLRRAVSYLSRVGLKARLLPAGADSPGGDGVIVAQEPPEGTIVARGAVVALRPGRFAPAIDSGGTSPEEREMGAGAARAAIPVRSSMR